MTSNGIGLQVLEIEQSLALPRSAKYCEGQMCCGLLRIPCDTSGSLQLRYFSKTRICFGLELKVDIKPNNWPVLVLTTALSWFLDATV